jgi:phage shock protein PspC (stress-responsive transcriptional regulator)
VNQQNIVKNFKKDTTMNKKLMKSDDRVLAGVCGGLAEYFDFDPVLVRVAYAFLTLFTAFSGLLLYIVLWIVMPDKSRM